MQVGALRRTGVCLAVSVFLVRALGLGWRGAFPITYPDSSSYLAVADRTPFSPRFWFDQRPPTYPLFLWLTGGGTRTVALLQTGLYAVAWIWLLSVVLRRIASRPVAVGAVILMVLLAVQTRWVLWAPLMLTESLTNTLVIAQLAAWWSWTHQPDRRRVVVAASLTVAWMLLRDPNAVAVLVVVVPAAVACLFWMRRTPCDPARLLALALAALIAAGSYSLFAQSVTDRGETTIHNNVGLRWLVNPEMTSFMVARGMPLDAALAGRTGKDAWADGEAFLRAPELAGYRSWALGRGRVATAESFVFKAPWYLEQLSTALPALTGDDLVAYDTSQAALQFPERTLGAVDPVGSRLAIVVWPFAVAAGAALAWRRNRRLAAVLATLLVSGVLDLYLSFSADAIEISRHMVSPLFRFGALALVAVAIAADEIVSLFRPGLRAQDVPVDRVKSELPDALHEGDSIEHTEATEPDVPEAVAASGWGHRVDRIADALATAAWPAAWAWPITIAGLITLAYLAVMASESSAPNFDPQYMRVLVERTMRLGGSYYSNGIHNKGPFEPAVYELAGRIGGHDGFWLVVAVFILAAACTVAATGFVLATAAGAPRLVAITAAAGIAVHLTMSDADYAGVLYARNLTVTLLAASVAIGTIDRCWNSERRVICSVAVIGIATGLAVQTMLTTCFAAAVVLLYVMWERRRLRVRRLPAWALLPAVSAVSFASAIAYYWVFGPWQDFVDGWWVYARYMSTATGRGLGGQFSLGWATFKQYYGDRPELIVALVAYVAVAALRWRRLDARRRALHLLVAAWWLAAWIELVLSQRYSSHYFSVLAVPTAMAIVLVAAGLTASSTDRTPNDWSPLLTLVAALLVAEIGGIEPLGVGLETAASVTSVHDFAARREAGVDGRTTMVRSTLDLVSDDRDPLLVWTTYPWPYLNLRRVSATRYIWKTFLLGEIYLAGSGPQYVLPGTWEKFERDLDRSDPAAFYVESVTPVDPSTPFAEAVAERFTIVYSDESATLALRKDLVRWLGYPVDGSAATPLAIDALTPFEDMTCRRLDLRVVPDPGTPLVFEFPRRARPATTITLRSQPLDQLRVDSYVYGSAPFSTATAIGTLPPDTGTVAGAGQPAGDTGPVAVDVTLAVGARAAVVLVGAQVVGAVSLIGTTGEMILDPGQWRPDDARTARMPDWSGC